MTRARILLLLTPLVPLSACSAALDARVNYGLVELDGGILTDTGIGAISNDFEDLGLNDEEESPGVEVDFKWGLPHLSISTTSSAFSGSGVTSSEISVDGDTIPIGTAVDTDMDIAVHNALLTFDFAPTDNLELGIGFGIAAVDLQMDLKDSGGPTSVTTDATLPIPVIAARAGIAFGRWEIAGVLSGIDLDVDGDKVSFYDFDAYGRMRLFGGKKHLAASLILGYRATDFDLEYEDGADTVDAELKLAGPYVGLHFAF